MIYHKDDDEKNKEVDIIWYKIFFSIVNLQVRAKVVILLGLISIFLRMSGG